MSIECIKRNTSNRFRTVVRIGRKRVSKTFERKIDAKQWEVEMKACRTKVGFVPASMTPPSRSRLDDLMTRFEKEHGEVRNAPSTRIMNRSLYNKYLAQPFGPMLLSDLTAEGMEAYLIFLGKEKGVSNGRLNRIRQLLHVMFNRAVRWRLLAANPISQIGRLPARDYSDPDEIQYLTLAEENLLLAWARCNDPWLYPKVVVLLQTGLRYGEMAALRVEDVRLEAANPHLRICRSRCRHTGQFKTTKGKRAHMIPLSPGLARFLEDLVQDKAGHEPLLWTSWEEGRWPTKYDKHFRKAIAETKVARITVHDLRHTFAVRFLENGGNVYDLKSWLGHSAMKLTMKYAHFSPAMAERARGIVDFNPPPPQLAVIDGGVR